MPVVIGGDAGRAREQMRSGHPVVLGVVRVSERCEDAVAG